MSNSNNWNFYLQYRLLGIYSHHALLRLLDWIGTISFAIGGTLTAGRAGMDLLGCMAVGTITATGGGTLRDLLLGNTPIFWAQEYEYLVMCLCSTFFTFFAWRSLAEHYFFSEEGPLIHWTDTFGLGAFAVIGVQNAIRKNLHPVVCIVAAGITCTTGGVVRDILCRLPVRIMHSHAELYATTAIFGATTYTLLRMAGVAPRARSVAAALSTVILRILAVSHSLKLPTMY